MLSETKKCIINTDQPAFEQKWTFLLSCYYEKHVSREIQMSEFPILFATHLLDFSYKDGACCNDYLDHTLLVLSCDAELVQ